MVRNFENSGVSLGLKTEQSSLDIERFILDAVPKRSVRFSFPL